MNSLRTNSVKEAFKLQKLEFQSHSLEPSYHRELAENIFTKVKFSSQNQALQNKTKKSRNVLPFVTNFNPAMPNLKKVLMKHWHLITESNRLGQIYSEPPIVTYRKDKSLKDLLIRAKICTFNSNTLELFNNKGQVTISQNSEKNPEGCQITL